MTDFWPACGWRHLQPDARGQLPPSAAWLAGWLDRPELALVAESCPAEIALHQALRDDPLRPVPASELAALADDDARENYRLFIALRDGVVAAGTLEAFYTGLFRQGAITLPPLFIDLIVQTILRQLLDQGADAFEARAAELLFRPQRITLQGGRVLAGDRATLDRLSDAGGFGALGRLLAEAQVPLRAAQLQVLGADNAVDYWHDRTHDGLERHRFVLDLTHQVPKEVARGVNVPLTLAHSGLTALARVLQRWVAHLTGAAVTITPLARIADAAWRWHVGLDVESTAILNDLYRGEPVDEARLARLIGLFRLDFDDPADQQPELAGAPVWLGLAMTADGTLRLKPQNLLLNLPLARRS
ncbi:MAG: DUF6352 family protein [Aquabacterium sp.]|nr:DUF6352 family protein [Aquabacterium sp.]